MYWLLGCVDTCMVFFLLRFEFAPLFCLSIHLKSSPPLSLLLAHVIQSLSTGIHTLHTRLSLFASIEIWNKYRSYSSFFAGIYHFYIIYHLLFTFLRGDGRSLSIVVFFFLSLSLWHIALNLLVPKRVISDPRRTGKRDKDGFNILMPLFFLLLSPA